MGEPARGGGLMSAGLCLLLAASAVQAAWAQSPSSREPLPDAEVFSAMGSEMERALGGLKQDPFGPPYFLAYRLTDERRYQVSAGYGSVLDEEEGEDRSLFVEARYGDRSLDNTDLSYQGWNGSAGRSPEVLRQNLWSLTDAAYKHALSGFLEKKAKRATEYIPEPLEDFSVEPAAVHASSLTAPVLEREAARGLAERLSRRLRRYPHVYDSWVGLRLRWTRRYLMTSEGSRLAAPAENVPSVLRVAMVTRAADGMRLDNQRSWPFRRLADLPAEERLLEAVDALSRELMEAREAPVQAPLAAPALLDPEFTGVLFHEALGHKLEGQRQRDPQQSQVFKDQVGKRVIPEFLSLWDDPDLAEFQGEPLNGHYQFDAEGVPAQRVVLIERGVLRGFLMSRWPVKGFDRSNGHGRADARRRPTGRMATLIVRAEKPVPREELFRRLLALARRAGKPYGFWLVGAFGGENPNLRQSAQTLEVRPRLAYRVDAKTGAKTLVRGVSLVGTPLVVLNRIQAAGDDATLANGFVCGAESGYVPVAQIAPSVLVSDVELQRLPEDRSRPPIMGSPFQGGVE